MLMNLRNVMVGGGGTIDYDWDYSTTLALRREIAGRCSVSGTPVVTSLEIPGGHKNVQTQRVIPDRRATVLTLVDTSNSTEVQPCLWELESNVLTPLDFTIIYSSASLYRRTHTVCLRNGQYLMVSNGTPQFVLLNHDFSVASTWSYGGLVSPLGNIVVSVSQDSQVLVTTDQAKGVQAYDVFPAFSYKRSFNTSQPVVAVSPTPDGGFVFTGTNGGVEVRNSTGSLLRSASGASYFGFRALAWPTEQEREVFLGFSGHNPSGRIGMNIDTGQFRITTTGKAKDLVQSPPCWLPSGQACIFTVYGTGMPNGVALYDYGLDTWQSLIDFGGTSQLNRVPWLLPCGKVFLHRHNYDAAMKLVDFGFSFPKLLPPDLFTSPFGYNSAFM